MPTKRLSEETLKKTLEITERSASQGAAAESLGISRSTLQHRLRVAKSPKRTTDMKGRSLDEFRASHDKSFIVPSKIKIALRELGGGWEYEMAFAKMAGVSLGDLSAFRSMFEDHLVLIERTKRAWAGTPATAEKMKAMLS